MKIDFTNEQEGSLLYFNGTDWVVLDPGVDGYFLESHGNGYAPSWSPINKLSTLDFIKYFTGLLAAGFPASERPFGILCTLKI